VDRKASFPLTVGFIVIVCAAAIYFSLNVRKGEPTTHVIAGSANPAALASASSTTIEPHVDEQTGTLVIQAGDEVDSNGILVGVTGVTAPYSAGNSKPSNGQFMLVNVEVHNSLDPGGAALNISPASTFELQDASGRTWAPTTLTGAPTAPSGQINPGATLNGALAYDVPTGIDYRLLFKNPQVSNGEIIIELGKH